MLDPLNLPGWMVTHWEQNAYDYRLTIRSLAPSATCPHCGHARLARHGVLAPGFRDVPMHGKPSGLSYSASAIAAFSVGGPLSTLFPDSMTTIG